MPMISIAKDDLLTLRSSAYDQFCRLRRTPANSDPDMQIVVRPEMEVLAKLIRKLSRACKREFGHDCHASFCDLSMDPEGAQQS